MLTMLLNLDSLLLISAIDIANCFCPATLCPEFTLILMMDINFMSLLHN